MMKHTILLLITVLLMASPSGRLFADDKSENKSHPEANEPASDKASSEEKPKSKYAEHEGEKDKKTSKYDFESDDENFKSKYESDDDQPDTVNYFLHGPRFGQVFFLGMTDSELADSPLSYRGFFYVGYEFNQRVIFSEHVYVIFAQNVLIGAFDQGLMLTTFNFLFGLEIVESVQIAVGLNITVRDDPQDVAHLVAAIGYTPRVGNGYIPIHLTFVPSPKTGNHRIGLSIGINFTFKKNKDIDKFRDDGMDPRAKDEEDDYEDEYDEEYDDYEDYDAKYSEYE